jgi:signal transduction histidine kinase/CheY-like chemotaxis protein
MENYPDFDYHGITGLEPDLDSPTGELSVQNRSVQSFYYPIHYFEPLELVLSLADFDVYSSANQREAIDVALDTFKPAVSKPFFPRLLNNTATEEMILLLHPGIPLSSRPGAPPRDLAALLIEIKALIRVVAQNLPESLNLYLYDSTEDHVDPAFLVGAEVIVKRIKTKDTKQKSNWNITYLEYIGYEELNETTIVFNADFQIPVAQNAEWTLVVVAVEETFEPNVVVIIVIGKFILLVCLYISLWIFYNMRRTKMLQEVKRQADAEKAAMIVSSARATAKVEQDLNDYIAHEVRNPLAAALSACSFVKSSVCERDPLKDESSIASVREDVDIIESSLSFMNDLLRSMLDMHRAASKKIQVKFAPVDVRQDILQPVATMLYGRDMNFQVIIECPDELEVLTDRLRLKQVILNLGRNATKFVRKGFVKLGALVVDGNVRLFVADSGFGISKDRRKSLFSKFQESLDVMNQGTGMGLCLCKNMTELMSGDIWLDESYESGVEGYPGTRFIIDLKLPPLSADVCETFIPNSYLESAESFRHATIKESDGSEMTQKAGTEGLEPPVAASPAPLFDATAALSQPTTLFATTAASAQRAPLFGTTAASAQPAPLFGTSTATAQPAPLFSTIGAPSQPTPLFSDGAAPAPNTSSVANTKPAPAGGKSAASSEGEKPAHELPEALSVLFVDDDMVLRKLFTRSVRKAASGWTIKDAANGETALMMVETENFDIIFVDQYMASVEKQLLGTETTRAFRSKGVTSRICGLSANDVEHEFLRCGADFFMFKPFPCKPGELRKELHHILFSKRINPAYDKASPSQEHSDSTSQLTQSTAGEEAR